MGATFSNCRKYRYTLWRSWGNSSPYVNFICLNPSTADETKDDNTIRKCVKFAKSWGYDAMCVTNLFAYRATDPKMMKAAPEPIGGGNDAWISNVARDAAMVICAWGQHGSYLERSIKIMRFLDTPIHYLRMGKSEPWHPLYLPDSTQPIIWETSAAASSAE